MISYQKFQRQAKSAAPAVAEPPAISPRQEELSWESPHGWRGGGRDSPVRAAEAMKISAFYRAVDIRSDSIGKYPVMVKDTVTRKEVKDHRLGPVLWLRPNEAMTPFIYKKLLEYQRLVLGNAYAWIYRDRNGWPVELVPLPPGTCRPITDPGTGKLWYVAVNPRTQEMYKLDPADILHYKGFSTNGIEGVSILTHAARTLTVASSRDRYELAVYENGGHPAGVLMTDADLSDKPDLVLDGGEISYKDLVRRDWDRVHAGAGNAFRVAVLDNGLKFTPISMSNTDAQFVESKGVSVADIARFLATPLHKLYSGDQAYESNEANSIDYVTDSIQPAVTQYEEEDSGKLLLPSERAAGLWIPRNMMADLRGDSTARGNWYQKMRLMGAYSVNDILAKEDEPDVPGGDVRLGSLNYVPLEDFVELSRKRAEAQGSTSKKQEE